MTIEIIVYSLLIITLLAVCDNRYSRKYYVPIKSACSASFLIILEYNIEHFGADNLLAFPLIACFIGDIAMGLYNIYKRKRFIIGGIIAFIIAHGFFLSFMMRVSSYTNIVVFILPISVIILMQIVLRVCHLHMGKIVYPGLIYCYIVSTMCAKAMEIGGIIGLAGVLFFLSDFSILFLYFYHFKKKEHKKIVHYFNLVTYYFAILLFIYSR